MKRSVAHLPLAVIITFGAAKTSASAPASNSLGSKDPNPSTQTRSVDLGAR